MYLVMKNLIQRVPIEYFNDCQNMILTSFPLIRLWSPRGVSFKSIGIKNFAYLIREDFCVIYKDILLDTYLLFRKKCCSHTNLYSFFFLFFHKLWLASECFECRKKLPSILCIYYTFQSSSIQNITRNHTAKLCGSMQ